MSLIARTRRVHFVGIGGVGMSGIAEILLRSGHFVSGSDLNASETIETLTKLGAEIQMGHAEDILLRTRPDVLVYSTAVSHENPELRYARREKIPIVRRAEMLAELMRLRRGIAIAGSHGKTTTTGLVALILKEAGVDPAVVIGGRFDAIGSNATWGQGQWLVAEADESDGSFLRLTPELAVVTNIDKEHLNHYGTFEATLEAFEEFLDRLPFYGRAVLCSDCANIRSLLVAVKKPICTYGFEQEHRPDYWVELLKDSASPRFKIHRLSGSRSETEEGSYSLWLEVALSVPGRHNILNATAAAIVARELETKDEVILSALKKFRGVSRRFDLRGTWALGPLIEDYAHHPTEIRATLSACRAAYSKAPLIVFQPHRFSRTRELWDEFAECFDTAEKVWVLPIYAASEPREVWTETYDGVYFARNVKGVSADFCGDFESVLNSVAEWVKSSGETSLDRPLLVLGAGDVHKIIPELLTSKAKRQL
jgi:UDP-N-acetylmuramate--alanine ligase